MIQKKIALKKIIYQNRLVDDQFINSIKDRGLAIAVKVKVINDDRYECVDGHKRLSAIGILYGQDYLINCVIANDFSKAGSGYWGATKNKH